MRESKFEFKLSGFIIGIILVAMFATSFATFFSAMDGEFNEGQSGVNGFANYNDTTEILALTQEIRNNTDFQQPEGALDVIGSFFSNGYSALKISVKSFSLFDNLMDQAAQDVEFLDFFKTYLIAIVLIGIFVGVVISVLVKMRI